MKRKQETEHVIDNKKSKQSTEEEQYIDPFQHDRLRLLYKGEIMAEIEKVILLKRLGWKDEVAMKYIKYLDQDIVKESFAENMVYIKANLEKERAKYTIFRIDSHTLLFV